MEAGRFVVALKRHTLAWKDAAGTRSAQRAADDSTATCQLDVAPAATMDAAVRLCLERFAEDLAPEPSFQTRRSGCIVWGASSDDGALEGNLFRLASDLAGCAHVGQILLCPETARQIRENPSTEYAPVSLGEHILSHESPPIEVFALELAEATTVFPPIRSLGAIRHNLPSRGFAFIGRYEETARILASLEDGRITSIVGPPGIGKSSLAWRAAVEWLAEANGSAWLVRVRDDATAESLKADLLNTASPHSSHDVPVSQALGKGPLLILIDSADRAVQASRRFARDLLRQIPALSVLVTARSPLRLPGEDPFELGPIALPEERESDDGLLDSEAVRLFLTHVESLGQDASLIERPAAAEIVRRLEGNPAMILAAASQSCSFGIEVVRDYLALQDREPERTPPFYRSLERSCSNLSEAASQLLARASLLCPTWDSAAATAVGSLPEDQTAGLLRELSEAGLVEVVYQPNGPIRFLLPPSVASLASSRLPPSERVETEQRHIDHFLGYAEEAQRAAANLDDELERMQAEYENVRLALTRAIDAGSLKAARFLGPLSLFWHRRRPLPEALGFCRAVCELPDLETTPEAARALNVTGTFLRAAGHTEESRRALERAYEIASAPRDPLTAGLAQSNLVSVYKELGNLTGSVAAGRRSVQLLSGAGDRIRLARALNNLTSTLHELGLFDEARACIGRTLQLANELGDSYLECHCHGNTAEIEFDAGNGAEATEAFSRELRLGVEIADPQAIALAIEGLGRVAARARQWEEARQLLGFAQAYRSRHELAASPIRTRMLERVREELPPGWDDPPECLGDDEELGRIADLYL